MDNRNNPPRNQVNQAQNSNSNELDPKTTGGPWHSPEKFEATGPEAQRVRETIESKKKSAQKTVFVGLALMVLAVVLGLLSSDSSLIKYMNGVVVVVGIISAIIAGTLYAGIVAYQNQHTAELPKEAGLKPLFHFKLLVAILLALTLWGLILVFGYFIWESRRKKPPANHNPKPASGLAKAGLLTASFVVGSLPVMFLTAIGSYILWEHWCSVTSAECI